LSVGNLIDHLTQTEVAGCEKRAGERGQYLTCRHKKKENNQSVLVAGHCVSQLSITVTNTGDKQLIKKKGLFWLTVSEVLVHGHLAPLLLGLYKPIHHGRRKPIHGGKIERGRKGRGQGQIIPFKSMPSLT
jgi:hypothetical protein